MNVYILENDKLEKIFESNEGIKCPSSVYLIGDKMYLGSFIDKSVMVCDKR